MKIHRCGLVHPGGQCQYVYLNQCKFECKRQKIEITLILDHIFIHSPVASTLASASPSIAGASRG